MAASTNMIVKSKVESGTHIMYGKFSKKINKVARKLTSKEHLELSDVPSRILCVQNGGLGNDVCQEELLALIIPFGEVEKIIMLPKKPFCFVFFIDESASVCVLENLNGHVLRKGYDPSQDVVLYFLYVKTAPDHIIPSCEKPQGLFIIENFVDEVTEERLLSLMDEGKKTECSTTGSSMKHRRVKHYGYEFKYGINDVDISDPLSGGLPTLCDPIIEKARDKGLINHWPDQITINQYLPGQGIPAHVDTEHAFEDGIMSLSLGSQVVMEFRHRDGHHASVVLPQRSLLVMTEESRYLWSHGITPRKSDIVPAVTGEGLTLQQRRTRTSFTFRKVIFDRQKTCEIDSKVRTLPQNDNEAKDLEREHVHQVYEDIADHFSGTRYKPWPKVVEFLMDQPAHSLMVDVGCGNGKCLGINKTMFEIGCDYSTNLVSICESRGFQSCVADVTCLPFRSYSFDVVLCIAVIHHMATHARRKKALSELIRILQSGGKALVYVWAMEQHFNKTESKYINSNRQKQIETESFAKDTMDPEQSIEDAVKNTSRVDPTEFDENCESNLSNTILGSGSNPLDVSVTADKENCVGCSKPLRIHVNRTQFQEQDMLVPWQLKSKENKKGTPEDTSAVFHRFYHVFKQGELEELCSTITDCIVRDSYHDQGNWCVVLEKL